MIHGNSCFKGWRRQGLECPSLRDFKRISQDYFTRNFPRGLGCPKANISEAISKVSPHPMMSVLEHQRLTCTYVGSQSDEIDLTRNIIAGAGSPVHQVPSTNPVEWQGSLQLLPSQSAAQLLGASPVQLVALPHLLDPRNSTKAQLQWVPPGFAGSTLPQHGKSFCYCVTAW